jgi:hypothetical protein
MGSMLALFPPFARNRWRVVLAVAAFVPACQTTQSHATRRVDRTVITRDQMLDGSYVTVYDAVAALRSNWLRPRGPDSFVLPSIVWVYVDGSRAGDVSILRNIQPKLVNSVRFYDGPTATGRWGVDNGAGVIHVSTWSDGAGGIPLPDSTRGVAKTVRDSSSNR